MGDSARSAGGAPSVGRAPRGTAVAGLEDHARLRADIRRALLEQAERAAKVEARTLALSFLQVAGIPVPASLVVHRLDVPVDPVAPDSALVALEARLRRAHDAPPAGFALDLARLPSGRVLRRVHDGTAQLDGADPVPSLVADYWIERPDGTGLVQLAFATPMMDLRETMLELFDAVAGALRWSNRVEEA